MNDVSADEIMYFSTHLCVTCAMYFLVRKWSAETYRVIQEEEESALLWEMIVWVILSKKVHTNMVPILNGYRVMGIF